jgi:hypothetical protein
MEPFEALGSNHKSIFQDLDSDQGNDKITTETSFVIKKTRKSETNLMHSIWTSPHGLCSADLICIYAAMAIAVKYLKQLLIKEMHKSSNVLGAMAIHIKYLNHMLKKQYTRPSPLKPD